MKISIGSDHAGYDYKKAIKDHLEMTHNFEILDRGTNSPDSVDYPDFAHAVSMDIESGVADFGVVVCGSANGVSMSANKHQHVRCAVCWSREVTELAREHNDANVIAIPARFVSVDQAIRYTEVFIKTKFEGGRHARRVGKIPCV